MLDIQIQLQNVNLLIDIYQNLVLPLFEKLFKNREAEIDASTTVNNSVFYKLFDILNFFNSQIDINAYIDNIIEFVVKCNSFGSNQQSLEILLISLQKLNNLDVIKKFIKMVPIPAPLLAPIIFIHRWHTLEESLENHYKPSVDNVAKSCDLVKVNFKNFNYKL
jgi:hypothetical protein